jgi:uncharacterized protein (TIGR03382 family)
MRLLPCSWLLAVVLFSASVPAGAVPLSFGCITNELPGDCAIGEAQVSVDVTDPGGDQITFTFANTGAAASSITDVYWDDRGGTLLGIASITNVLGVSFASPADPANLSGANNASPPFETTPGFSADSDAPTQQNGVNPGEQLIVTFDLTSGSTFADVVADLTDGELRIGVRVQGFASDGGESFVNTPVPEPGTAAFLGLGLLVLSQQRRRRHRL